MKIQYRKNFKFPSFFSNWGKSRELYIWTISTRNLMHLWTLNALGKKEIALSRIVVGNKAWGTYIYLRNRPKGDRINSARLLLKSGSRKGCDLSWPHFQIIFVSRRENLSHLMRIFFYICFFCFRLQSWCLLSPLNVSDLTHSQKSLRSCIQFHEK